MTQQKLTTFEAAIEVPKGPHSSLLNSPHLDNDYVSDNQAPKIYKETGLNVPVSSQLYQYLKILSHFLLILSIVPYFEENKKNTPVMDIIIISLTLITQSKEVAGKCGVCKRKLD